MTKLMLIDATHEEETRVLIADETRIHDFDISATSKTQNKGNVYLAKVTRVEPSLQAAFVEYGGNRQGFLPFSEIHPDYYQIPIADRQRLLEEAAAEINKMEDDDEEEGNQRRGRGRRRGGRRRNNRKDDAKKEENVEAKEDTPNDEAASDAPQEKADGKDNKADSNEEKVLEDRPLDEPPAYIKEVAKSPKVSSEVVDELVEEAKDAKGEDKADGAPDTPPSEAKEEVETLEEDDEEDEFVRRRSASYLRRYNIQEVIKRGQVMLIQVIKEERGTKGASLSTYVSLAGRYCVLMPNSPKTGGISRKIANNEDRKRLKQISEEMRSKDGMSAIIRTAGIDRTRAEIKRDYDYLIKLWDQIRELTLSSTAPAMVYEEADIIKRSLRDLYSSDIKEVVVAGEESFKRAKEFMKLMMPSHVGRVKQHKDATPIFYTYGLEEQLLKMHEPQVRLESGGSIVINPTEALVAIDVNSGRSTTERNVEETALKTNLEAAREVARQLRLRDLAGLVVVDFIDMFDYKNRRAVEREMKAVLKNDRAKIQIGRISAFGLLEMSRQRLRPSLSETFTTTCPHCEGKGFVFSADAQAIQMLRMLEREAATGDYAQLTLRVPLQGALYILNNKRDRLTELEEKHGLSISVEVAENLEGASSFLLERITDNGQKTEVSGSDGMPALSKRARMRKRKKDRTPKQQQSQQGKESKKADNDAKDEKASDQPKEVADKKPDTKEDGDGKERPARRRGRRGGRNRNRRSDGTDNKSDDKQQKDAAAPAEKAAEASDSKAESKKDDKESKPAARGGARKRAPAKSKADADKKADASPTTDAAPKEGSKKAPAKKPEAKDKPANNNDSGNEQAEAAGGNKRAGWWRRIVE